VAFLALSAGVPVVPVAITGTEKLAHALPRLRRVPLSITYGEPVWLGAPGQRERADQARLEAATTEIMCRLAALLPPEYRGVYAGHPRVQELLAKDDKVPG
jgi:1-acyl-sn-glycerol-3-phosphate acyltransferase